MIASWLLIAMMAHGARDAMAIEPPTQATASTVAPSTDSGADDSTTADAPPTVRTQVMATRPSVIAAAGGEDHLWFVLRRGALAATLGHVAPTMTEGEYQQGLPLPGHPAAIAAWGAEASLLFPPRTALMPRPHLLSTSVRRNPATGLWISVPADRLELRAALPSDAPIESMIASADGLIAMFEGEPRAWRLQRAAWQPITLPEAVERAARRRLEPRETGFALLATSGDDGSWERWRADGENWSRHPLSLDATFDVQPAGGPALVALVSKGDPHEVGAERRILSLPDDGPIVLATLDSSIPAGSALAWFRGAPVLIDGETGAPRLRRIDPVSGEIGSERTLIPQRSLVAAWSHLPILGAVVVSLLMIVFFVRSLRDEREQRLPDGWEPLPFGLRLAALGIDLIPGVVITKFALGVPWSSFLAMPWLVIDADAALPMIVAPIITVAICMAWEIGFSTTPGKRIFGGRVVTMRATAATIDPAWSQTVARNIFKSVVLQMQLLAVFTLIHPLGQGVGESVSATAVVRRRAIAEAAPST